MKHTSAAAKKAAKAAAANEAAIALVALELSKTMTPEEMIATDAEQREALGEAPAMEIEEKAQPLEERYDFGKPMTLEAVTTCEGGRSFAEINALITFDESGNVILGDGTEKPGITAVEYGRYIRETTRNGESALEKAACAFYHAGKISTDDNGAFLRNVVATFDDGSLSERAVKNIYSLAKSAVPFRIAHGITTPLGVLKDAMAAVAEPKTGKLKTSPEAVAVMAALKAGISQAKLRKLRAQFDSNGQPLPLPPTAEEIKALADKEAEQKKLGPVAPAAPSNAPSDASAESESSEESEAPEAPTQDAPPTIKPPEVRPITESEKASAIAIAQLDRVLEYVTKASLVGDERTSFVTRAKQLMTLLQIVS